MSHMEGHLEIDSGNFASAYESLYPSLKPQKANKRRKLAISPDFNSWAGKIHSSFLRVPTTQGEDCEEDSSEAKLRSERDSQIVKRSVVQVDFIACLQSQSERSPETLKTGAGIHGKVRPGTSNSGNRVAKIA
jgi:hypothetical protein